MKYIILMGLILISSLSFANNNNGVLIENIVVKVTKIDRKNNTIEFVINDDTADTLKLDPAVIDDGYYDSNSNTISLNKLKLNRNYYLRIVNEYYENGKNKNKPNRFVSAISTVLYDTLF